MKKKYVGISLLSIMLLGWNQVPANVNAAAATTSYQASTGFTSTQVQNNWYYQQGSGNTYSDLTYNTSASRWDLNQSYPWVSSNAQHPGNSADSVRTWISPGKGTITISGSITKGSADGDGIQASIKKDNTTLWTQKITTTADQNPTGVTQIAVVKGTQIHFVVNKVQSISFDHTLWNPTITYTASSTPDDQHLSIVDFGAIANDGKDDYDAITKTITEAKKQGKAVYVPAGNFSLSQILKVDSVAIDGESQDTAILTSTDPYNGSIDLSGTSPALRQLTHTYQTTSTRDGKNEKNNITVRGATKFTIDHVTVNKSSTAGIFVMGQANQGTITNNIVQDTGADGIHTTDGSYNITIENNQVNRTLDDMIAVVSYGKDVNSSGTLLPVHDVKILNNQVNGSTTARGISVVGGHDVLIQGNSIQNTPVAGILVATEAGEYNTQAVDQITVNNNTLNYTASDISRGHFSIFVTTGPQRIDNVTFNDNTIIHAGKNAYGTMGSGPMGTINFNRTTIIEPRQDISRFENGIVFVDGVKVYSTK